LGPCRRAHYPSATVGRGKAATPRPAAPLPDRSDVTTQEELPVGHAADAWSRLTGMLESGDLSDLPDMYHIDALFLEPYNPPHRGNLLIQAYLKDYLGGKDEVVIDEKRVIEGKEDAALAVEWTISYTAGGRRWNELPRATFIEFDEAGLISYQRDYS
jgi:hypothetical protein